MADGMCTSMVDFEAIAEADGLLVPIELTRPCGLPIFKVLEVDGHILPLCEKHAALEWLILAATAEKAEPDA